MRRHVDRWNGFSLELPEGWEVSPVGGVILAGPSVEDDSGVIVWPFELREPADLDALLPHVARTIARGDSRFESWAGPRSTRDGTATQLVFFRRPSKTGVPLRGSLRVAVRDRAGWVSGFQAPEAEIAAQRPLFEKVLASFRVEEPLPRERFTEPGEGAFGFSCPRGWRVSGRVQRAGGAITPVWEAEDPRTRARVAQHGTCIPFTAPLFGGPGGFLGGFGAGFGGPTSRPFTSAEELARTFLLELARRERPDLVLDKVVRDERIEELQRKGLASTAARLGGAPHVSGALAWTTYTEGGARFREVAVIVNWTLGGNSWFCNVGPSFRAPVEAFDAALPILRGIAESFRVNQAWDDRQADAVQRRLAEERAAAERYRAQKTQETLDYVHRIDREIAAGHSATLAELNRIGSNTVLGKEDVLGEAGRSSKVDSGYEGYWEKEGKIIGSSSGELDTHLDANGWKRMTVF